MLDHSTIFNTLVNVQYRQYGLLLLLMTRDDDKPYSCVGTVDPQPVAPVVQLVTSKASDVGT